MLELSEAFLFKVMDYPKHLQTTLVALLKLGYATASDVSAVTHKARAVESMYLNQLVLLKAVNKERRGRKAVFTLSPEALGK